VNSLAQTRPLRILLLQDCPVDAELNQRVLRKAGIDFESKRVEGRDEFIAALEDFYPDLVLADYNLPNFDGLQALTIVRERSPHLPYIFISGALGEEDAIRALHQGASDYLLKDRLHRLPEAVARSLREAKKQQELLQVRQALHESEARFRTLVETSSDWIWEIDQQGRYLYCSPSISEILGYSPEQVIGRKVHELMSADEWLRFHPIVDSFFSGCKSFHSLEWACIHQDGSEVFLESSGTPLLDPMGNISGYGGTTRDVTERKQLEAVNLERAEQFRVLFEQNADGIIVIDAEGAIAAINTTASGFFGRPPMDLIGMPFGIPVTVGENTEIVINGKLGDATTVSMMSTVIHWKGKEAFLVSVQDFTEHKKQLEQLDLIAHHDTLTGLPNRILLRDRLRQAIAQNRRANKNVAICYLDLDGFKEVNDTFGHEAGDFLLVEAAHRMQSLMRGGDTVARLGGDEFVMLLGDLTNNHECQNALERLGAEIAKPYQIRGQEYSGISASIGVTIFPDDTADPDTLVRHADHAMYFAKQSGKNQYVFFDAPMEKSIEARIDTVKRIELALQAGQMVLHYQPKFDFSRGAIAGVEALIRWQHPILGLLPPSEFLPVIEDSKIAIELGDWVIAEALRQMAVWKTQDLSLNVSVNACARQLTDPGFTNRLQEMLRSHSAIAQGDLQIELVETGALKDFRRVQSVIKECLNLGVKFSLDDFGTGYSTLEYLRHLPASEIKIDQSFVTNMLENKEDETIVKAVIGLGETFRLNVVAEGAETTEHIKRLFDLGCYVMQGYAIAKPMSSSDVITWVKTYKSILSLPILSH
jgi:diguanylate cyclase (GGDEF)-like protein/PAS domain S-box-containing protein